MAPPTNGNGENATEVLQRSVTREDYNKDPTIGGVYHFVVPALGSGGVDLPGFWSFARDWVLHSTLYRESMWSAAISIAISKVVAQGYDVNSDIPLRAKRGQQLMTGMDSGRGYVSGLQKHLLNFLLTGNGAHVEIVRASRAAGSRVIGMVPLDTFRCYRTGDPDYPIIYRSRDGRQHEMRSWEVFSIADMPDPQDTWYGIGHCAAERAYKKICTLEGIERYIFEKVTGQRALSVFFVKGVGSKQITDAIGTARGEAQAKGMVTYMGAAIAGMVDDVPLSMVEIPLADLPDGFNRKEEWDIALTTYARNIGIAVQDLQPLAGQGLGTGTQTMVLDESAKGQGLAAWRQAWEYNVNEYALDDRTTYAIRTNDIRDREREAKVRIDEATAIEKWTAMGISPAQAINLGVDRDQLPPQYRVEGNDLTPGAQYSDDEKPAQEAAEEENAPEGGQQQPNSDVVRNVTQSVEKAAQALREFSAAQERREKAARVREQDGLTERLDRLITLAEQPEPETVKAMQPIVVKPTEVHVAAPKVVVQPAPAVPDTATLKAVEKLNGTVDKLILEVGKPRRVKVKARDADGRMSEWEES